MSKPFSSEEHHELSEIIAASPPLHSSSTWTLLETLVHLFYWFSSHPSMSKEAFTKNLQLWHSILPEGNCYPTSYRDAFKIIKPYLVPEVVFHTCVNDCILFRGQYKENVTCPKCNEPRFKRGNIPRRTFHYLPLGPRLARSFGARDVSYLLQSHGGERSASETESVMNDIHDSPKWKEAFGHSGTFQGDPRGVALSLCLDSLNPWSKNKTNYSMWPIVLGQLNLPRRIRYHFANLILVGIIPSQVQGAEPKDLDPYLEVLVDEIIYLSRNQKKVKDSSSLPSATFGLNKKQMEEADTRAKRVIVPAGDPFSPGPIFSRMSRMNSHEWKGVSISS